MSESIVLQIANGNSLVNKVALVLNRAGDSMHNPIMRGLGMAVDLVLSPTVSSFEATLDQVVGGGSRILTFTPIDNRHYRLRAAAGYGVLGFSTGYADAVAHYLRLSMTGPSHVLGTERLFWVEEDPLIELGYCAGSAVQSAWTARVSEAYYGGDIVGTYGLSFDPGKPDVIGVQSASSTGNVVYVEADEDLPVEFAIYDVNQVYPLDIPCRLMENWKDEFNQKHFGGSLYVSVFEEGQAEDFQGTYIQNVYQDDISEFDAIRVLLADQDHEYRVTFRFKSELNDPYYVDKTITFRVLQSEVLNRAFASDLSMSDMPDVVYNSGDGNYYWDGMAAAVVAKGFTAAFLIVDDRYVGLPLDDVTPFDSRFADMWVVTYGGELKVQFQRPHDFFLMESSRQTYLVDEGTVPAFTKTLFRRFLQDVNATFAPDTQFRLCNPNNPAIDVCLEILNNQTIYKQAVVYTEKGSVNLECPLKNGYLYNIETIVDVNPVTGAIQQDHVGIILQTENSTRVYQIEPMVTTPRMLSKSGSDSLNVTITPAYPDVTVTLPALTVAGEAYAVTMTDGGPVNSAVLFGRKGVKVQYGWVPGAAKVVLNGLSDIAFADNARAFFHVRFLVAATGESVDQIVEFPVWLGYAGTPPDSFITGPLQMILYARKIVVTSLPANLDFLQITGDLSIGTYSPSAFQKEQLYDISALVSGGAASVSISYEIDGTPYGPITVPTFNPMTTSLVTEFSNNGVLWQTGRLVDGDWQMPKAKIDHINKTITFDYLDRFTTWLKWSIVNPHNGAKLVFNEIPPNLYTRDITRLFPEEPPFNLQVGQRLLVTFLHQDGPHVTAMYKINGEYNDPEQQNDLRGEF